MPLGVTTCSEKVVHAFNSNNFTKTLFHGHSYTANPLACAVANKSFELLMSETCQAKISEISLQQDDFKKKLQNVPTLKDIRSIGTIAALELKTNDTTSYANDFRKKIYPYFLKKKILLRPLGNVIYIVPPYIITRNELQYIHDTIEEFLAEV